MNIHFSTSRSVCKHVDGTYKYLDDKEKLKKGTCCEHKGNLECECKEKFCPLKQNIQRKVRII